jgi:hypothetical protein
MVQSFTVLGADDRVTGLTSYRILQFVMCGVLCSALLTGSCALCTVYVFCVLYCVLCSVPCVVYCVLCTVHCVLFTCTVSCGLCPVYCTAVPCAVYGVLCTVYCVLCNV